MTRSSSYLLLILILWITGCVAESSPTSTTAAQVVATVTPTATLAPSPTPRHTETSSPTMTPTPTVERQLCETTEGSLNCSVDFRTVVMWDKQTGWIFGEKGIVLRYKIAPGESNSSWQIDANLPDPYPLAAFSPVSPNEGWGISGYITRYQNEQWEATQEIKGVELRDILMLNSSEGWGVGRDMSQPTRHRDGLIFHYTQGEWIKAFTLPFNTLLGIDMLNETEGWAVGGTDGVVVRYHNQQWERVTPSFTGSHTFLDVDVVSEEEVWIVGSWIILHYDNGIWEEVAPDLAENLLFDPVIDMVSPTEGWIVGRNGYILHYQNGRWQAVDSPTENDLLSISMVNAKEGWAVGQNGTILHYQDGAWVLVSEAQ